MSILTGKINAINRISITEKRKQFKVYFTSSHSYISSSLSLRTRF